jgi:hypothetical protein
MRTTPVSDHSEDAARLHLPVLARLPDLDAGVGDAGNGSQVSPQQKDPANEPVKKTKSSSRRRRRSEAGPSGSSGLARTTARLLKFKPHLLATIIVLAFVVLIGTLVFHHGPAADELAGPTWDVVQDSFPSVEGQPVGTANEQPNDPAVPSLNHAQPRRLPPTDDSYNPAALTGNSIPQGSASPESSPLLPNPASDPSIGTAIYPPDQENSDGELRWAKEHDNPTESVR